MCTTYASALNSRNDRPLLKSKKIMVPALITGGLGILGQSSANKTQIELAEANKQWAENQRATAHQTEVKDLEAAGLNPILSATGGSGAQPVSPPQTPNIQNVAQPATSSAVDVYKANIESDLKNVQTEIAKVDNELKNAQIPKAEAEAKIYEAASNMLQSVENSKLPKIFSGAFNDMLSTIETFTKKYGAVKDETKKILSDILNKIEQTGIESKTTINNYYNKAKSLLE
ncbi:DNA pilot protein [Microviridae sp.]|nr:DNA pilot protein [Microviridae sp.]